MFHQLKSVVNRFYNHLYFYSYRTKPAREVFFDIYNKGIWNSESFSGPGSELHQTKLVRQLLQQLIVDYKIKSLLDVPCGDWFWMRFMDLSKLYYTGVDIVEDIIEQNQKFANEHVSFRQLNLLEDELPCHDLVLCRDCLVHFSYQDIQLALKNLLRSDCKYLLTTTFPDKKNYNIVTGNWRPVNLEAAPFLLPKPIFTFNEGSTEGMGQYKDKSLALWDLNELRNSWDGLNGRN